MALSASLYVNFDWQMMPAQRVKKIGLNRTVVFLSHRGTPLKFSEAMSSHDKQIMILK